MQQTTFAEFSELTARGNLIPVYREIMADLLTPVSAFLVVAHDASRAFLLESVEGGERIARYSFLGKDPFLTLRPDGGGTIVEDRHGTTRIQQGFVAALRERLARIRPAVVPGLPRLTSGAVGFIGYDAADWFEPALAIESVPTGDDAERGVFMFFDTVLAFDHVKHRILIIANVEFSPGDDLDASYTRACSRLDRLEEELSRPLPTARAPAATAPTIRCDVSQEQFEGAVDRAKESIVAGEVYQVVLSRRFDADTTVEPFAIYRTLRQVNPSPYLYFLRVDDISVVGSSPEMLVRVDDRAVETHPIAGTRPRGMNAADDARLAQELLADEKERAEHVMLVDLGRNDLGRVSRYGTVTVSRFMEVVRYSHVMHIASTVQGELAEDCDCLDALAACFPAGTVSGAPKIRAMQLIRELENEPRGLYAGAIGYIDFAGNLDFCIAIRTVVIRNGVAHIQAGAGVVFDSDPTAEFTETSNKANALLRALQLAHTISPSTGRV